MQFGQNYFLEIRTQSPSEPMLCAWETVMAITTTQETSRSNLGFLTTSRATGHCAAQPLRNAPSLAVQHCG